MSIVVPGTSENAYLTNFRELRLDELRGISIPRTTVNRARDGEEGPSPHIVCNGCGQALIVVSPVVVIDSYAIPDNMLTAAYLVMSYWPS
jgi:hypothetical protein